jgi:hypothetical protein
MTKEIHNDIEDFKTMTTGEKLFVSFWVFHFTVGPALFAGLLIWSGTN